MKNFVEKFIFCLNYEPSKVFKYLCTYQNYINNQFFGFTVDKKVKIAVIYKNFFAEMPRVIELCY